MVPMLKHGAWILVDHHGVFDIPVAHAVDP